MPAATQGQLRLGFGIYWPVLEDSDLVRRNKRREPRPKLAQCQLHVWPRTLDELAWFQRITETPWYEEPDWRIFLEWPTMRQHGSRYSCRRALLLAAIAFAAGHQDEAARHLGNAGPALVNEREPLRSLFENRRKQLRNALLGAGRA